ncbi:Ig-like domain-containing protein [Sphaerotilus sp.]|uniref:Ig-like domain-containing protein n=1 Tax=Sphaerotilus sp. TaxID=2093942 RepID=UPI00286DAF79|nr:Ig-like domain-containing protein [Sphaerotilus sp.]
MTTTHTSTPKHCTLSALSLSIAVLLSACGGGDATAPDTPVVTDTTPPTVVVTNNVSGTTASGNVTFTFTFSEDVGTSFTTDDIVITGGTKGTFTRVSGTQATLVVTPTANTTGSIGVSLGAGVFADTANNANTTATTASQAYNTVTAVASTTLVSFSETTAPVLTGFGGAEDASVVADPADATNKVAKIVKSATAESWAGATVSICPSLALVKLPFSATDTKVTARVWSPDANIPVRLKLEDAADGTKSVETEATVTTAAGWQTLTFNFANPATSTAALSLTNTYNKASVFFNFGKTGAQVGSAKTYYLDDLTFVGSTFAVTCPAPTGKAQKDGLVNFDETAAPTLTGFGGAEDASVVIDPTNPANKVAKIVKSATAELWAGTTVSHLANQAIAPIAFSASNTTITARVWSPDAGIAVRLKVENASDTTKSVETEATTTVAGGWQTLTFNFANQATGTAALNLATTYNKASIFFNFGKTGAQVGSAKTYYLDDLQYTAGAATTTPVSSLPVTFDASAVTYTLTGFGGAEDSSVVTDPVTGSGKVAKVVKSATAELWAGTTVSTGANLSIATLPFSATAKTMTLKVWAPAAGIPVRLKVEDAADATHSVETEATTTVAGGWETLSFNFASPASGTAALNLTYTYNKASVFFNFGKTGAAGGAGTYYFDTLSMP